MHQPLDAGVPRRPGLPRGALDADLVLHLLRGRHRVHGRHQRVGTGQHVGDVPDVLDDAVQLGGGARPADDGAHLRTPVGQRAADRGAHQTVRTGDHDDGGGGGAHAPTLRRDGHPRSPARWPPGWFTPGMVAPMPGPLDPSQPIPDDPGELLPDAPEPLPPAPVEPTPEDPGGDPGGVPEPA